MALSPGSRFGPYEVAAQIGVACVYGSLSRLPEALGAIRQAWEKGYRDANWTRRDPDLIPLHGHPEFERLYPLSNQPSA